MNLGNLQEKLQTTDNSNFLKMYQLETLEECNTVDSLMKRVQEIFTEADNYASTNDVKYKYLQLAQEPLWSEFTVESEGFIYQGFEANVEVDLSESVENIKLFVTIQNNNVSDLKEGQRIEIDSTFVDGLNDLQKEIFLEAKAEVEARATDTLKKVWIYEKERMDKWVKTCNIQLKG